MTQENDKKVLIIGAGPAGLTAAHELSRAGYDCVVLEKDSTVGGISRTVNYKNYHFDIGGHRFFTKAERVEQMWRTVLGEDLLHRVRLSRIYFNKKFFNYPLSPMNCISGLGVWRSFLILFSYLYAYWLPAKREETFEQWVCNRFGKRLYETFFKSYTEKVWGMPGSEIRAEWAAQRIKGLSLSTAVKHAFARSFFNNGGKTKTPKTLIGEFDYPKLGPGMMWRKVADITEQNGSQVLMESEVEGILREDSRLEALEVKRNGNTDTLYAANFISSMPIGELVQKLRPPAPQDVRDAADALKHRDFLTVALIINKAEVFPDNWIYVHEPSINVGRVQNFKNWSPFMVPDPMKTCLGLEYFCFEGDSLWSMEDVDLIELAKKELESLGLARGSDVEDGHVVRMPKAYPVYDSAYERSLAVVREFLGRFENLQLIGRNGTHRYNNQDHSMLMAMLAAENIQGAGHDLWKINSEAEYHEEINAEEPEDESSDTFIRSAFARMDKLGFATAVGTACGMLIFVATLLLQLTGEPGAGPTLQLLGQYFMGYEVSFNGALIGAAYSFFWGFLFGWLFAYLRNFFLAFYLYRAKRQVELLTFRDFLDQV